MTRGDATAVQRWTGDPVAVARIPLGPTTPDEAAGYVRQIVRERRQRGRRVFTLGIVDRADGELVGTVGLTVESAAHRRAEIGYVVRRDRWGRGLASDAVDVMVDLGFGDLGLNRIWAVCIVDNDASTRVLEKAGFRREGRLRSDLLVGGRFHDTWLYATLEDDRPRHDRYV